MKKQVVIIHGGDTFASDEAYVDFLKKFEIDIERYTRGGEDWKPWLRKVLGDGYQVIIPQMPNKNNAKYELWEMWMDRFIPFLKDGVVFVGHSLGASFLAKYLSTHQLPVSIGAVCLVAGVYNTDSDGYGLESFTLPETLNLQTNQVFLYHSKDDPVVPFDQMEKFARALPQAETRALEGMKHINQEEFTELLEDIKGLQ